LLRFSVRRCVSVRAVSDAVRQRADTELRGDLEGVAGPEEPAGGAGARSADLLKLLTCAILFPLPGARVHGRRHARTFKFRLRQVCGENRQRDWRTNSRPAFLSTDTNPTAIGMSSGSAIAR